MLVCGKGGRWGLRPRSGIGVDTGVVDWWPCWSGVGVSGRVSDGVPARRPVSPARPDQWSVGAWPAEGDPRQGVGRDCIDHWLIPCPAGPSLLSPTWALSLGPNAMKLAPAHPRPRVTFIYPLYRAGKSQPPGRL